MFDERRDHAKTAMNAIAGWLTEHGLAPYVPIFAQNVIDIDVLFDLTEPDLEKLGIPLGDRKRMLKALAFTPNARTGRNMRVDGRATASHGSVLRSRGLDRHCG